MIWMMQRADSTFLVGLHSERLSQINDPLFLLSIELEAVNLLLCGSHSNNLVFNLHIGFQFTHDKFELTQRH